MVNIIDEIKFINDLKTSNTRIITNLIKHGEIISQLSNTIDLVSNISILKEENNTMKEKITKLDKGISHFKDSVYFTASEETLSNRRMVDNRDNITLLYLICTQLMKIMIK